MNRTQLFVALLALAGAAGTGLRADGGAGPYLAGRVAASHSDYRAAADGFSRALLADPTNTGLMQSALLAELGSGDFDKAKVLADALTAAGAPNSLADLTEFVALAGKDDFKGLIAALDAKRSAGPLADGLLRAWAELGAGQMSDASATFDALGQRKGLAAFALYHKALALASVGDFGGADRIFSGQAAGPLRATRRGIKAHAQILSQLERNKDAVELIDKTVGKTPDAEFVTLRADLEAGKILPFTIVASPRDGIAETFFTMAAALSGETAPDGSDTTTDVLMFTRAAAHLRPDLTEAVLLAAETLDRQDQHALAIDTYAAIAPDSPAHTAAELGRAAALAADDKPDAATEALAQLAKAAPDDAQVWLALGDAYRRTSDFAGGVKAYDQAIALVGSRVEAWSLFYARGICHERLGEWPAAEADFRKALDLAPDQPQVLNYLGYSYLEKHEKLDEALSMIERAVKAEPQSGAITDSLGWAQYRMGRYGDAVATMERAIELMPVDSVVNDHLGDVYWAVGRKREAEFQWKRALSFKPESEKEATRIRRKLEAGLDAVLKEEGAEPLAVSTSGSNGG